MWIGKDVQNDPGIGNVGSSCHFLKWKSGNAVYKDMFFITLEKFIFSLICLIESSMFLGVCSDKEVCHALQLRINTECVEVLLMAIIEI